MVKRFNNDATTFYVKCVDTANDQIVSFALWQQPHATETEEEKAKKMAEQREKADELPKGTNKALMVDFESATEEMRRKYVDAEKDYGEPIPRDRHWGKNVIDNMFPSPDRNLNSSGVPRSGMWIHAHQVWA